MVGNGVSAGVRVGVSVGVCVKVGVAVGVSLGVGVDGEACRVHRCSPQAAEKQGCCHKGSKDKLSD